MNGRHEIEDLAVDRALAESAPAGHPPRGRLLHHPAACDRRATLLESEVLKVRGLLRSFDAVSASEAGGDVSERVRRAIQERKRTVRRSRAGVLLSCGGMLASAAALVVLGTGWVHPGKVREAVRGSARESIARRATTHAGARWAGARSGDFRADGLVEEVARLVGATMHGPEAFAAHVGDVHARNAVDEVSLGVRALLAAGSTPSRGRHATVVRAALDWIEARLGHLDGTSLASALAACVEGAMSQGERLPSLATHAERLAGEVVSRPDTFCAARIPARVIADAGVSLTLSAALGGDRGLVGQARALLAAHLAQRLAAEVEGDAAIGTRAAMLFAFPDLVRSELATESDPSGPFPLSSDRWLAGRGASARHLAWSFFPSEAHWAGFQAKLIAFGRGQGRASLKDVAAMSLAVSVYHDGLSGGDRPV